MISYDSENFAPPAPVAFVKLINPVTGQATPDVPMLLDSGADITVLPAAAVSRIGVIPEGEIATQVYNGQPFMSKVARLHIKLGKARYPGEYVVAEQAEVGFLGRDVLNSLVVELQGPMKLFSLRRR